MYRYIVVLAALILVSGTQMGGCGSNPESVVITPPPPPPNTPPTVLSTSPANGATNVPVTATILVTFSQAMDSATISGANLTLASVSPMAPVSASVSLGGDQVTASIVPSSPLAASTSYMIGVSTVVRNSIGMSMEMPYTCGFTTGNVADMTPPTFAGATSASTAGADAITVRWSAASDNATPASEIIYLIYAAFTSGGQNFASPTATSAAGATEFTLTGLNAGATCYVVVRARDASNNIDSNTAQVSAATPAPLSFASDVWPILYANCAGCHYTGKKRPYMESASVAYSNLVDGYNVKPGDSANSLLYQCLIPGNPSGVEMPPGYTLSDSDIQTVKEWIDAGAPNN